MGAVNREGLAARVGERLRDLRRSRGLSLSEVARRSGVGKGTLSELEAGRRNATLETLFAVTAALGAPLAAALPDEPAGWDAPSATGDSVDAWLLDQRSTAEADIETYRLGVRPGTVQTSPAHAPGVTEQILVVTGTLRTGDMDAPVVLMAGQSTTWTADRPHTYEALHDQPVSALLVMRYPHFVQRLVSAEGMDLDVHEAKTHLFRLFERVALGEEITIRNGGRAVARLVPAPAGPPRELGRDRGKLEAPDDFNAPLPDDVLDTFER